MSQQHDKVEQAIQFLEREIARQKHPVEHRDRDWYARVSSRDSEIGRDWGGSWAGGRVFGGGTWSGGRDRDR